MTPLIGLAQILAIGFLLYLLALIAYTVWSLTHPHRQTYASAISRGLPGDPGELDPPAQYEEKTIRGPRGELALWIVRGAEPQGPVVVMTHGWGSSRQGALKRIAPFIEHASSVVVWDLPGHGDSEGITRLGSAEHEDLASVCETIEPPQPEGQGRPIVLVGWSMGAGVSLAFARRSAGAFPIRGIICEAPYIDAITPARNVIRLRGIPHRLNLAPAMALLGAFFGLGPGWNGFARDRIAEEIRLPILILHGGSDPVCPIDDARKIRSSAPDALLVTIEEGGHNNLWTDPVHRRRMHGAVSSFLSQFRQQSASDHSAQA